jgi:hypothetical protein
MSKCKVKCLGKKGTSFNYILSGRDYIFRGECTTTVDSSIFDRLKNIKGPKGKPLFIIEDIIEEIIEEPIVEPIVEEIVNTIEDIDFTESMLSKPQPKINTSNVTKIKSDLGKKQGKLI